MLGVRDNIMVRSMLRLYLGLIGNIISDSNFNYLVSVAIARHLRVFVMHN